MNVERIGKRTFVDARSQEAVEAASAEGFQVEWWRAYYDAAAYWEGIIARILENKFLPPEQVLGFIRMQQRFREISADAREQEVRADKEWREAIKRYAIGIR